MPFSRTLTQSEGQTALSWIRTRVADSISYGDNRYAKHASFHSAFD